MVVMTEHGAVYPRWRMRPGEMPEDEDWEVPLSPLAAPEFSEVLQPLHRHRARLSILDGLGNAVGLTTALNEHKEGHATALTGTQAVELEDGPAHAQGPSIDQIVASAIAEAGQIASLQVSHGSWPYSYDASGKTLPYIYEPAELYTRLFPDGPGGAPLPTDVAAIRVRQRQVVELARAQFSAVAPRLGAADRVKVEQHRDLLRALELQLEALSQKTCDVPAPPGEVAPWEEPEWYDQRTELFTTLIALALSCDLTRVGVLALWGLRNEQVGAPPGDIHNDFAHAVSSDPVAAQVMTNFGRYHAEDVAKLLDVLEDIPSAGGRCSTTRWWCGRASSGRRSTSCTTCPWCWPGAPATSTSRGATSTGGRRTWCPACSATSRKARRTTACWCRSPGRWGSSARRSG
nr:DUF1552 domain-containing protein [Nannocystis pusilla]